MSTLKAINLQHPTAPTANITLSNTGGIALNGSVSGGGMDLITPASVVGGTFNGGVISFSAATSLSVNGCFTSAYENYVLKVSGVANSSIGVLMRLRSASVDASASNYIYKTIKGDATSVTTTSETQPSFDPFFAASTGVMVADYTIYRPNLAQTTMINGTGGRESYIVAITGYHSLAVQYDGFSLLPTSGNITGSLRVYGLRNS